MSTKKTICLALVALAVALFGGKSAVAGDVLYNGDFEGVCVPDTEGSLVPEGWLKYQTVGPILPIVQCVADNGPSGPGTQAARFSRASGSSAGRSVTIQQDPLHPVVASQCESVMFSADIKVISHNLEAGGWVDPSFEWPAVLHVRYERASDGQIQDWKHGFYVSPPGDGPSSRIVDPGSGIIPEYEDTLVQVGEWTSFSFDLMSELPDFGKLVRIYVGAAGWAYEGLIDNVSLNVTMLPTGGNRLQNGDFEGACDTDPAGWNRINLSGPVTPVIQCVEDNGPSLPGSYSVSFSRASGSAEGRSALIYQDPANPIVAGQYDSIRLSADIKVISHNLEAGGWVDPAFEWPAILFVTYRRASDPTKTQQWKHGFYLADPGDSRYGPVADPGSGIIAEFEDTMVQQNTWTPFTFELKDELPDFGELVRVYVGAAGWAYSGRIDNVVLETRCAQQAVAEAHPVPSDIARNRCLTYEMNHECLEESFAIRVTSVELPDVVKYAGPRDQNGNFRLVCEPTCYAPSEMPDIVHLIGRDVVPGQHTYEVTLVPCETAGAESMPVAIETAKWGDVTDPFEGGSPAIEPDFHDIGYLVNCFTTSGEAYPIDRCELEMEQPDGVSDFRDIQAGVNAFLGKPYPYADPVSCGATAAIGEAYDLASPATEFVDPATVAHVLAVPRTEQAAAGELIDVDFFLQYDGDVRTYQLSVTAGRGGRDTGLIEDLRIEREHEAYVFAGEGVLDAVDTSGKRLGGMVVAGGADVSGIRYLGTASIRVPVRLKGQIDVNLTLDGQTFVLDSDGNTLPLEFVNTAKISSTRTLRSMAD